MLALACLWASVPAKYVETSSLGLGDSIGGHVLAFGDLDSDKHMDVFIARPHESGGEIVVPYLYNKKGFRPLTSMPSNVTEASPIIALIPGDFNFDGRLDLITFVEADPGGTAGGLIGHVWTGSLSSFAPVPTTLPGVFRDVPLVFDYDSNLKPDFLAVNHTSGERTAWVWSHNIGGDPQYLTTVFAPPAGAASPVYSDLRVPFAGAFADLDGDCLADMLLVSAASSAHDETNTQLELWINARRPVSMSLSSSLPSSIDASASSSSSTDGDVADGFTSEDASGGSFAAAASAELPMRYRLQASYPLPVGAAQISVGDVDGDGTMDILVPVCRPAATCADANELHVIFNAQIPMCSSTLSPGSGCRRQQSLCTADPGFIIGNVSQPASASAHAAAHSVAQLGAHGRDPRALHTMISTDFFTSQHRRFAVTSSPSTPSRYRNATSPPLTIRIGDSNLDGFPDLLIPIQRLDPESGSPVGRPYVELWLNTPCTTSLCSGDAVAAGRVSPFPSLVRFAMFCIRPTLTLLSPPAFRIVPRYAAHVCARLRGCDASDPERLRISLRRYPQPRGPRCHRARVQPFVGVVNRGQRRSHSEARRSR